MKKIKVPLDLIFVPVAPPDTCRLWPYVESYIENEGASISAVPLLGLNPAYEFIRYVVTGDGSVESFWQWKPNLLQKSTDKQQCIKVAIRKTKLQRMNFLGKNPEISFFDSERDRFLLKGGLTKCILAKIKGKSWIKAIVPENELVKWKSRSVDTLNLLVNESKRDKFYNPIYHKKYQSVRVSRPDSVRLDRIRFILGPLGVGLSSLDIGCNMGFTSHHFARHGFDMTGIDFNVHHLAVAQALNETYGLQVDFLNSTFKDFQPNHQFDVVVALTVLYHLFFRQKDMNPEKVAKKVGELTKSVLFWESGGDPEQEKKLLVKFSGLSRYFSLGTTEGTGLKREMGIFVRPGTMFEKFIVNQHELFVRSFGT